MGTTDCHPTTALALLAAVTFKAVRFAANPQILGDDAAAVPNDPAAANRRLEYGKAKLGHDATNVIIARLKDLRHVCIDDDDVPNLYRRVYDIARTIPPGGTLTYGEIAERLGDRTLARDVGEALSQNPWPIIVPCHRVLAAG